MRIHFIAIGGSAMHNLAIALKQNGHEITGSDDEIFEPSKSRLKKHGILPTKIGWQPEIINTDIDIVILGMHAREDNPELIKAKKLKLKIFSYPEFLYERTKNKLRIVIGGSHGKTTVTSMIMHVLKHNNINFDYMVGASIEGFDTMVNLEDNNEIAVFEGDEYLSSPIDRRPKFHLYKPKIAVITGIAWDHVNVFPTYENYIKQFEIFLETIEKDGTVFYYKNDKDLSELVGKFKNIETKPYDSIEYVEENQTSYAVYDNEKYEINIFGNHNMQNLNAALKVCHKIGVSTKDFFIAVKSFKGAAKRLQKLYQNNESKAYIDFAHAPSKVKATVSAVKDNYKNQKLVACLELHTFSSLKKEFLPSYKDTMKQADISIVYFSPEVVKHKKMEEVSPEFVQNCFNNNTLVFTCSKKMKEYLRNLDRTNTNILFMSSGNFNGIDFKMFSKELLD